MRRQRRKEAPSPGLKAISGFPKTAGGRFRVRPHDIIDEANEKRQSTLKYALSIEAPFKSTLERVGISGWINQIGRYCFTTPWE